MSPPRQHSFIAQAVNWIFVNIFNLISSVGIRRLTLRKSLFQALFNLPVRSYGLKITDALQNTITSSTSSFPSNWQNDILTPWEAALASSRNGNITLCGNPPKVLCPIGWNAPWDQSGALETYVKLVKKLISPEVIFRHTSNPSIFYVEALFMILKVLWPFEGTVMDA